MDATDEDMRGWVADGTAAGLLAFALGICLLWLGHPNIGMAAASGCGLVALALLRQVEPEPRRFRLPEFALPDVTLNRFEDDFMLTDTASDDVLLLTDRAVPEALLLEDRLDPPAADSRVVALFAARPLPTPGELQQRIEAHLTAPTRAGPAASELNVDAAAALRVALGDLRRSLA